MNKTDTYGLYIHIPFCESICSYCDFFVDKNVHNIDKYCQALIREIHIKGSELEFKSNLSSIYFGGGTPSLLSPDYFEQIFNKLSEYFSFNNETEISIESNPVSLDLDKVSQYKSLGINRVSVGVQTFVKRELGVLKRNHSPGKAVKALEVLSQAGIENFNLDLIFSIPGQTMESLEYSLETALKLGTKHISSYSLIFEENTPLYKRWKSGKVIKHSDEADANFYNFVIDYLNANGFKQYEVSNFAKTGYECRHNLGSWHSGEYFAFGISSHGYLDSIRFKNYRNFKDYYSAIENNLLPIEAREELSIQDKAEEYIFLSLRADGTDIDGFFRKFNVDLREILRKELSELIKQDLIKFENGRIRLTKQGYMLCDSITFKIISGLNEQITW